MLRLAAVALDYRASCRNASGPGKPVPLPTGCRPGMARDAVIDARSEQAILVRQAEFAVIDPSGADRRASDDLCPIIEVADPLAGDDFAADTGTGDQNFRAEPARLLAGALGEVRAADAFRKSQKILDLRTAAGLSADRIAFYHNGL